MEFRETVRTRRTTRAYTNEPVSNEQLQDIIQAAQLAPVAGGDYSRECMVVIRDPALLSDIREQCSLRKKDGTLVDPLYGAPVLILFCSTGPSDDRIEYCDIACAIENMLLAATDSGLGSTYLWGFLRKLRDRSELLERLGVPEGWFILSALAVGYAVDAPQPREPEDNIKVIWN